jgi:ornithine cyclodeaminase
MTIQVIGREAEQYLTWDGIVAALEAGHRLPRAEVADLFLYRRADTVLDRAAWIDGLGQLVKFCTVFPGNAAAGLPTVNGVVAVFSDTDGLPRAFLDFHMVTKWKTAGDSLLAARRLARPGSRKVLIVGAGTVARSMVDAYRSSFPDAAVTIWNRGRDRAVALAAEVGAAVAADLPAAVAAADIICTATMSKEPVIRGDWLRPGQHLDLIGAYNPSMREVDDVAMARTRLFVDSRATTIHHIGDLIEPIRSGAIREADVIADFYDIAAGQFARRSEDEITIAKNGGGAHLDLMTADWIAHAWAAR